MNKSETIKELALALSKAQAEMPPAELNAVNPFLKNKYADLGSLIKAAKPVIAKHGLSISQLPTSNGDGIGVTTILMHSSGEWLESTLLLPLEDSTNKAVTNAQAAGAIISYLRRYSIAAVLGMYADEDVDGNGPKSTRKTKAKPKAKPKSNGGKMSLESASKVINRDGVKYVELDTEKLAHMANALTGSLKGDLNDENRIAQEYKLDAIAVILASR